MEIVCGTRYINLIRLAVRTARLLQMRNINIDWHSYVGTYSIGVCFRPKSVARTATI